MTIDNMPVLRVKPEFLKHTVHHLFILPEMVVGILFLPVCLLVCDKIPLKGCHPIFSIKRRVWSRPDVPQNILAVLLLLLVYGKKCFSYIGFQFIIKCLAFTSLSVNLNLLEGSVLIQGNASME